MKDFRSDRLIKDLPISSQLKQCLEKKGFERPTEIQDRTLEALMQGKDLLGHCSNRNRKNRGLPGTNHRTPASTDGINPYALVVVPTRELALQVEEEFKSMTKGMGLFSACFIGGTNINRDLQTLTQRQVMWLLQHREDCWT